jgi:hypothetical protein
MSENIFEDVVEILQRKLEYHKKQVKIIEKMLSIANSNDTHENTLENSVDKSNRFAPKTNIPWTKHIREIFSKENTALTRKELHNTLASRGVADMDTISSSYNTIIGIVARLVKHGELIRVSDGTIRRGPNHPQNQAEKSISSLIG